MERKTINYTIKYFERGKDKEKLVRISKISRDTMTKYGEVIAEVQRGKELEEESTAIIKKMADIIISRDINMKETRALCKPMKKRLDIISDSIPKNKSIFNMFVSIVNLVCDDNGIEDKELRSSKFWSKKTEPIDILEFLNAIVFKDVEGGKSGNYVVDDDMLFAALFKYYGPVTREQIGKMDVIEFQRAVDVCVRGGMPESVVNAIWKKRGDSGYLEMMMPRKKDK